MRLIPRDCRTRASWGRPLHTGVLGPGPRGRHRFIAGACRDAAALHLSGCPEVVELTMRPTLGCVGERRDALARRGHPTVAPRPGRCCGASPAERQRSSPRSSWWRPMLRHAARGDGHAVLVGPGFLASDLSTTTLRRDSHPSATTHRAGKPAATSDRRRTSSTGWSTASSGWRTPLVDP